MKAYKIQSNYNLHLIGVLAPPPLGSNTVNRLIIFLA